MANPNVAEQHFVFFSSEIVVFFRYQLFQYMADEGAETPTVLPKIDFYFILQTAASEFTPRMEPKVVKSMIMPHHDGPWTSKPKSDKSNWRQQSILHKAYFS